MAHINLLPWRENLRQQRQRKFIAIVVGSVAAMGLIVGLVHMHFVGATDYQNKRNGFLNQEISLLDKKIRDIKDLEKRKNQLLARMDVIQRLQASRPQVVHLVDELVGTIPDGVRLISLKHKGEALTLQGEAQSNARVSAYMRNLEASDWLVDARLNYIKKNAAAGNVASKNKSKQSVGGYSAFTLKVKQAKQKPLDNT